VLSLGDSRGEIDK